MTEVVAALIWDKNKFMICQRPAHKARGLLWEFVGGKVEPGETKQQALIRECREELAVTLDVGDVFMDVTHKYPDLTVHLTLFHATIREGVPQKLEHNDICWITLGEIDQYEFCPADKVILERLKTESKSKQYFPVLLNEAIVCSFYSLSRLAQELTRHPAQTSEELQSLDLRRILPRCSPALRHMRMVAAAAFTVVDMGSAGLQAYFTHKGDPSGFALCFLQKINYVGLIRVGVAGTAEAAGVVGTLYGSFAALAERQKDRLAAANPALEEKAAVLKKAAVTVGTIGKVGTPLGFVSAAIGVYDEMSKALAELNIAREERIRVEEECAVRVRFLREHEAEMEVVVEQYMTQRLKTFVGNSDLLEEAFAENDADTFLSASAQIQKQLGWNETISSQDQFDAVMLSEEPLKL